MRMLAAMRTRTGWRDAVSGAPAATLGWCGWREPRLSRFEQIDVVIDGTIFKDRKSVV